MEDVEACGFAVVVGPTGPQSDRATELRQVVNAIRENGNNPRILAVPTYFGDQREDRLHPDGPAVSEAAKLMARSIIDAGADAIITFDIHNRKTLGSVDLPFHSLTIAPLLVPRVAKIVPGPIAVVAPDASAAKIARKRLATPLKAPLVTIHKDRDTITLGAIIL
jgi:phosphoribosylpyrophosphate synthetase